MAEANSGVLALGIHLVPERDVCLDDAALQVVELVLDRAPSVQLARLAALLRAIELLDTVWVDALLEVSVYILLRRLPDFRLHLLDLAHVRFQEVRDSLAGLGSIGVLHALREAGALAVVVDPRPLLGFVFTHFYNCNN